MKKYEIRSFEDEYEKGRELLEKSKGLLNGYIKYLIRAKNNENKK